MRQNDTPASKAILTLTRREALQGIAGLAASSLLPLNSAAGKPAQKHSNAWPADADLAAMLKSRILPFNDDWRFHRGDTPGADAESFDHSGWRILDIPHDWSIEDLPAPSDHGQGAIWTEGTDPLRVGPFDVYESEGQISTGWTVGGIGWYRKIFDKPVVHTNGIAELRFEGVYMNYDVWLNGAHLGNHPYGYTPFTCDITPHLKEGRNTVAVRVKNIGRNSRWYSGSGIFRKVWLAVNGDLRIPEYGVSITTPEVSKETATVNVEITVENGASAAKRGIARVRLINASGATAAESEAAITVPRTIVPPQPAISGWQIRAFGRPMIRTCIAQKSWSKPITSRLTQQPSTLAFAKSKSMPHRVCA